VRAGRAAPRVGAPALQHDDRLRPGRALRRAHEPPPVAERFHEARDERRLGIVDEVLDDFRDVDVRLVADRHEARDAEPARAEVTEDQPAVRAALRDDADAALRGRQVPEVRAVEPCGRRVDAHAVRAHETQPRGARSGEEIRLDAAAVGIDLAESGGEDDGRAHAARRERADRLGHGGRRQADEREIDPFGEIADAPHGVVAEDRVTRRVHGMYGAGEAPRLDVLQQPEAELGGIARHAEHGDRAGREQRVEAHARLESTTRTALPCGRSMVPTAQSRTSTDSARRSCSSRRIRAATLSSQPGSISTTTVTPPSDPSNTWYS
jgi:hypothetical protein